MILTKPSTFILILLIISIKRCHCKQIENTYIACEWKNGQMMDCTNIFPKTITHAVSKCMECECFNGSVTINLDSRYKMDEFERQLTNRLLRRATTTDNPPTTHENSLPKEYKDTRSRNSEIKCFSSTGTLIFNVIIATALALIVLATLIMTTVAMILIIEHWMKTNQVRAMELAQRVSPPPSTRQPRESRRSPINTRPNRGMRPFTSRKELIRRSTKKLKSKVFKSGASPVIRRQHS